MQRMTRKTPILTYAQQVVQQRTGRDLEEFLRELYIDRGLSQEKCAAELGVSRLTLARWLNQFGIERKWVAA